MSEGPSFVVYVDESGDEGFSFAKGSSSWFVISAVITHKATDLDTVKLVDDVRAQLGKPPKKPLHFRDLKHEQRLPFIGKIAAAELRIISVLAHKPSILEPEKFRERFRLYFYSTRFLLERVSWYCRDHRAMVEGGDGAARILFSNRSGMAYAEMASYLELLRSEQSQLETSIDWSVIKPQDIGSYTPGKRMGPQIADAVASSGYYAVERSRHGYAEDRYMRMLSSVIYRHGGACLGYGLKFWPSDVLITLREDDRQKWLEAGFK